MLQSCHTSRAISFVISITFNCQPLIEHRVSDLQLFRNSRHLLLPSVLQLCKKQTFSYYPTYDSPLRNVYIFNVSQIARISDRRVKRSSLDRRGEREREPPSNLRTITTGPCVSKKTPLLHRQSADPQRKESNIFRSLRYQAVPPSARPSPEISRRRREREEEIKRRRRRRRKKKKKGQEASYHL